MGAHLLVVQFVFGLFLASPEARRVSATRVKAKETTSVHQSNELKVLAWTWNSYASDLSLEAESIFNSDADVIVTCQTEAIKAVREYTDDSRWLLVSHGEHTGFSGGHSDAQILSVFLRQPAEGAPFVAKRPDESEWTRSGIGLGIARLSADIDMEIAEVPGLMSVKTTIHQTSSAGKGGLSAHISWEAQDGHAAYKTSFLCAHLDSQSEAERSRQLVHIFRDMNGLTEVSRSTLERMPCLFWDYHSAECQEDVHETLHSRRSVRQKAVIDSWLAEIQDGAHAWDTDAVIILGDLNYRLSYWDLTRITPFALNETEPLARLVSTPEGRQRMAVADPLNPHGSHPTTLVRPFLQGFGFECNDPYRAMPWTYKRRSAEDCANFGAALRRCEREGDTAACEEAPDLARKCYAKRDDHDGFFEGLTGSSERPVEWSWQTKGSDLQLGWLDRVCVRSVGGSALRVTFEEPAQRWPWGEIGSADHMAVASLLRISLP